MKIAVACENCGHRHQIDAVHAGRRGKCSRCGTVMTVPTIQSTDPDEESEVYGLEEPSIEATSAVTERPIEETTSAFRPAPRSQSLRTNRNNARIRNDDADERSPGFGRIVAIIAGIAFVALLLVALIMPGGVRIAGSATRLIGLGMALVGFGVGAYSAFCEDSLYGILYIVIPFFTAYYIVTRIDDLGRWMGLAFIGLVLITIGGVMTGVS